jgi:hypothetical protein
MMMLNQKSRALGAADFSVKNPSAFNTMTKLFQDDRHPLSPKRGRNILNWAKDSDLPKKWQAFLVPHMQTALLKKLKQKPTSWTDLSLVEKELASRDKKAIKPVSRPSLPGGLEAQRSQRKPTQTQGRILRAPLMRKMS